MGNQRFIGMTPAAAATAEASVLHELGSARTGIFAFQHWDTEAALKLMLLACADPRRGCAAS